MTQHQHLLRICCTLILIFIASSYSDGLDKCRDVTPMSNLSLTNVTGVWFILGSNASSSSGACGDVGIMMGLINGTNKPDGSILLGIHDREFPNSSLSLRLTVDKNNPGTWNFDNPKDPSKDDGGLYTVVDTDYKTFTILWICSSNGSAFVALSRIAAPNVTIQQKINNAIKVLPGASSQQLECRQTERVIITAGYSPSAMNEPALRVAQCVMTGICPEGTNPRSPHSSGGSSWFGNYWYNEPSIYAYSGYGGYPASGGYGVGYPSYGAGYGAGVGGGGGYPSYSGGYGGYPGGYGSGGYAGAGGYGGGGYGSGGYGAGGYGGGGYGAGGYGGTGYGGYPGAGIYPGFGGGYGGYPGGYGTGYGGGYGGAGGYGGGGYGGGGYGGYGAGGYGGYGGGGYGGYGGYPYSAQSQNRQQNGKIVSKHEIP